MMMKSKYPFCFLVFLCILLPAVSAASYYSSLPHTGQVTSAAVCPRSEEYFTAGQDGFLIKWNRSGMGDHYQVSDMSVRLIAVNPQKDEIAVYETDGFGIHRVSVWDWQTKKRKYAKRFTDTVISLSYSARGTWLMVGTTSLNGFVFLDSATGNQKNILSDSSGIVSFAVTSTSESSAVIYSPSGLISYIDLRTGKQKAQFSTVSNLEQPVLYGNNMYLAGIKNGTVYEINATTGNQIAEYPAPQGFLLTAGTDSVIRYAAVSDSVISVYEGEKLAGQFTLPDGDTPAAAAAAPDFLLIGGSSGSIYAVTLSAFGGAPVVRRASENNRIPITDAVSDGTWFYFLTDHGIYRSSYTDQTITLITPYSEAQNMLFSSGSLFLWTKGSSSPVMKVSAAQGSEPEEAYTPSAPVTSVSVYDGKMVIVENGNIVTVYDTYRKQPVFSYRGTGFQDAFLFDGYKLFVSKTGTSNPRSPVIYIDIRTGETVMLPMTGNMAYNLKPLPGSNEIFFGVMAYAEGSSKKTERFQYNTTGGTYKPLAVWNDEDLDCFIYPSARYVYSNIGKAQVTAIDRRTNRQSQLERSGALPAKITDNSSVLLVLNSDGSVSWYDMKTNRRLGDWYVSSDGDWYTL